MKYFFVLGNNPALSVAELAAILNFDRKSISILNNGIITLDTTVSINATEMISRLGGTIKIGEVVSQLDTWKEDKPIDLIVEAGQAGRYEGKFNFGISNYSDQKIDVMHLGLNAKKILVSDSVSCRLVTSREHVLSSVVVRQNKLLDNGIELCLMGGSGMILLGRTLAVQDFKGLERRDYGRPARDDRSGMLPPKLAQIMINLSGLKPGDILLDPFCGSGTILSEAALMGFENLVGSDISEKAINDTNRNMDWLDKILQPAPYKRDLKKISALSLSEHFAAESIDGIVTEPYLGPQRGNFDYKKVAGELEELYSHSLVESYKILKKGGRIVMVWPVFAAMPRKISLDIEIGRLKIVNPIPEFLQSHKSIHLTSRDTIIYGRPGQKVWREIVLMKK